MNLFALTVLMGWLAGGETTPAVRDWANPSGGSRSISSRPYVVSRPGIYSLIAQSQSSATPIEMDIQSDDVTVDLGNGGLRVIGGSAANIRILVNSNKDTGRTE